MPAPLQPNFTFEQIKQWIFNNIANPPIIPIPENLHHVPKEKGIYFWFMHPDGYKALSNFLIINPIEPRVEDKDSYHLVYLGTAGTGKNGGGHLLQRLKWHILQQHTISAICSGSLSTLRSGIGALLSNDLILFPNSSTEYEVNNLFRKYFKVYWIEYIDNKQIDNDEDFIISKAKPIFNINNNPNALIAGHLTFTYKERRRLILNNSKIRLGCNNGSKTKNKIKITSFQLDNANYELKIEGNYTRILLNGIVQNVNVKEVLRRINTEYEFNINLVDSNGKDLTTNVLGKKVYESLRLLNNDDYQNPPPHDANANVKDPVPPSPKIGSHSNEIPKSSNKNELGTYLITCSNSKANPEHNPSTIENLSYPELLQYRLQIIRASGITLDWEKTTPAWRLYSKGNLYRQIDDTNWLKPCVKINILSALFGWIKHTDLIPTYNLKMDDKINNTGDKINRLWLDFGVLQNYIHPNDIDLLSKPYREAINKGGVNVTLIAPGPFPGRGDKTGIWLNEQLTLIDCKSKI